MTPLLGTKTHPRPSGQVGWGHKSRPVSAFLRVVARHGAAMARHGRHGPRRAAARAPSAPARGPFGFSRITRHESRTFRRSFRRRCAWVAPPGTVARSRLPCSRLFTIVHDCSPLFTIVRHCSAKNITPEPAAPLRPHRQRGLYGSSRVTKLGFPFPCGGSKESNPKPDQQVFTNHETRITNHGFFSNHGFCFGAAMARHERHIASAPFAASHAALRARSATANAK